MSLNWKSGAVLFALGGALGCTTYPTYKQAAAALDCTLDSNYLLDPVDMSTAFTYGDPTPGAVATAAVTAIPDGARCTSTSALQIISHRYNDWGSAVSFYGFHAAAPVLSRDETGYEGLSFWARSPGASAKAFTLVLDDFNTYDSIPLPPGSTDPSTDPDPLSSNCISYSGADGGGSGQTVNGIDQATGMVISNGAITVTPANACGNGYQFVPTVTSDWQFYVIPFNEFHQTNMPNRVPNSLLKEQGTAPGTSLLIAKLTLLTLRMAKESDMELWIDKLGFYRTKGGGAGTDGGADAR